MNLYEQELHFWASKGSPISMLSGKTVLLSGATGAIGRCLIDLFMMYNEAAENTALRRKADLPKSPIQVIALSRNIDTAKKRLAVYRGKDTFRYIPCDVNQMIPECGSADYIIHAASNTHPLLYSTDSIGTIASNVIGTKNLLDYAAAHHTEHFCFLSSVEIYGENRGDTEKFDETYLGYLDSNTLRAGYPESKRLGEALCNAYRQTYGIAFDIPRLSRVYGPTMLSSDTKALSQFLQKAAAGEDIVLKSKGNQKFSYTFVTDAAAGILYSMLLGKSGNAYNIADEASDITLKELARHLADIAGSQVVFELPDETERRGYSTATKAMLNAAKLKALGWKPRVNMADGLKCTVEAMKKEISPDSSHA